MNKKLNVGVIGCGEIAQISHIPYLLELPNYQVSAICDLSPTVVERLGEKFYIPKRYTNYNDLVKDSDVDIVLVSNKNHALPALAAMEHGKHVFVEKPIAFNLKQADEIIKSMKANQVKLMVGYMKRYDPAYMEMAQKIQDIEKVHLIRVHEFAGTYLINREIYDLVKASDIDPELLKEVNQENQIDLLADIGEDRSDLLDAHDIMIHLSIHDINALHGLYGLPESIKSAELFDSNFVTAMMQYDNGVNLIWESGNLVTLNDWDEQITFFGSNLSLELRFPFPYLKNAASELNIRKNGALNTAVREQVISSYDEAFRREWQHFYDCIINDKKPNTDAEQARRDLEFAVELTKMAAGI
jgi:predicted dehydrogenase